MDIALARAIRSVSSEPQVLYQRDQRKMANLSRDDWEQKTTDTPEDEMDRGQRPPAVHDDDSARRANHVAQNPIEHT